MEHRKKNSPENFTLNQKTIAGYSNQSHDEDGNIIYDTVDDFIDPGEWRLKDYLKNPIILGNHNRERVIGKSILTDPRKNRGLFQRVQLSDSDSPDIKKYVGLIREGILKSFSINCLPAKIQVVNGKNHLKSCDLIETSVVTVGCNRDSIFDVEKSIDSDSFHVTASKILKNAGFDNAAELHSLLAIQDEPQQVVLKSLINPFLLNGDSSDTQALAIAKALLTKEEESDESESDEIKAAIKGFETRLDSIADAIDKLSRSLGSTSTPADDTNHNEISKSLKDIESKISQLESL